MAGRPSSSSAMWGIVSRSMPTSPVRERITPSSPTGRASASISKICANRRYAISSRRSGSTLRHSIHPAAGRRRSRARSRRVSRKCRGRLSRRATTRSRWRYSSCAACSRCSRRTSSFCRGNRSRRFSPNARTTRPSSRPWSSSSGPPWTKATSLMPSSARSPASRPPLCQRHGNSTGQGRDRGIARGGEGRLAVGGAGDLRHVA